MSENSTAPAAPVYVLGRRSKQRLADCHPVLADVVAEALSVSPIDFTVLETLRTEKRQRHMVRQGKSWTKNSRHLGRVPKHAPELGPIAHAVDLGAWIDDTINWDWDHYFDIADAMKAAAEKHNIRIKWGGCWDYLDQYDNAKQARQMYIDRKKEAGEKPLSDGPHFELCWKEFPV
ncbi:MAG: hypothetical protein K6L74_06620 [Neptuniibacter sp.]